MTNFFFADNNILVNFALIGRMDLLETLFAGRGTWCATVKDECQRSSLVPGLDAIVAAEGFLGNPHYPNKAEHVQTQVFRTQLAKVGDHKYEHLGEAETLAVMASRFPFEVLVTDDRAAARIAEQHNIKYVTTWSLLQLVVRRNLADPHEVLAYLRLLRARGAPRINGATDLNAWARSGSE
jgi:predicted nucleic acid-binding protein